MREIVDIPLILNDPESTLRKIEERLSAAEWDNFRRLMCDAIVVDNAKVRRGSL